MDYLHLKPKTSGLFIHIADWQSSQDCLNPTFPRRQNCNTDISKIKVQMTQLSPCDINSFTKTILGNKHYLLRTSFVEDLQENTSFTQRGWLDGWPGLLLFEYVRQ